MVELSVLLNGNVVGRVHEDANRKVFEYVDGVGAGDAPLSMSLPTTQRLHTGKVVENWLFNLLPDNTQTLQWIANDTSNGRVRCSPANPVRLLAKVGEDCAGAVQIVPPERVGHLNPGTVTPLSEAEVEERVQQARLGRSPMGVSGEGMQGRFSLAGAQPKLALRRLSDGGWASVSGAEPTTHILKPPIPDMSGQVEGEHFCLVLARHIGLNAAESEVLQFRAERVIAVRRFDRELEGGFVRRLHVEDMCQAMGYAPGQKYQNYGGPGISDIMTMLSLHSLDKENDRRAFFKACVFNWVIGGTDAHAKNFSVYVGHNGLALAPLYDLNTALPYVDHIAGATMSMSVGKRYKLGEIQFRHWFELGKTLGFSEDFIHDMTVMLMASTGIMLPMAIQTCLDGGIAFESISATARAILRRVESLSEAAMEYKYAADVQVAKIR